NGNSPTKFRHEDMSVKLIEDLFHNNGISIEEEELKLIQALVSPRTHPEIVLKCGIDVDKWDYFARFKCKKKKKGPLKKIYIYIKHHGNEHKRDSRNVNLDNSFTHARILAHSRVIDDQICYHEKTNFELFNLFRTRYELFKRVYSHKTSKAVEYMICDIFVLSNGILKITDKIDDRNAYLQLTDNLIQHIDLFPLHLIEENNDSGFFYYFYYYYYYFIVCLI
ncbi:hypothetical protein RFI_01861, partial [Reticulomyxa filosa]